MIGRRSVYPQCGTRVILDPIIDTISYENNEEKGLSGHGYAYVTYISDLSALSYRYVLEGLNPVTKEWNVNISVLESPDDFVGLPYMKERFDVAFNKPHINRTYRLQCFYTNRLGTFSSDYLYFMCDYNGYMYNVINYNGVLWMVDNFKGWTKLTGSSFNYDNSSSTTDPNFTMWNHPPIDPSFPVIPDNEHPLNGFLYNGVCVDIINNNINQGGMKGWRVPSDEDWDNLITYLGTTNMGEYVGSKQVKRVMNMDEIDSPYAWVEDPYGGINTPGDYSNQRRGLNNFSLLPSGCYTSFSHYHFLGIQSSFWSSTPNSSGRLKTYYIQNIGNRFSTEYSSKENFYSIRLCIDLS